jgi:hypothetical protein
MGVIMYQINQITGYGLRSFGQFPTMQEAAASLGSWVNILCAEIDDDHPDCMDVMSNDGRQFTIEPVKGK